MGHNCCGKKKRIIQMDINKYWSILGMIGVLSLSVLLLCPLCKAAVSYEDAVCLYRENDPDALDAYEQILRQGTKNEAVYLDCAVLYKEQGRYHDAIRVVKELLFLSMGEEMKTEATFFMGELYYLQGEEKHALSLFEKFAV